MYNYGCIFHSCIHFEYNFIDISFIMEDNRADGEWDMQIVATPLILQGLHINVYPGRDDNMEALSYPFDEWSCDTLREDILLIFYWLK